MNHQNELTFFLTINTCNLKCMHCYAYNSASMYNHKSYDEVVAILKDLAELRKNNLFSNIEVKFHHEPTLDKNFPELLKDIKKNGLSYKAFPTNGYGIVGNNGDNILNAFKNNNGKVVSFSFYGLDNSHDIFSGKKGSFDTLMKAVSLVEKHDIPYVIMLFVTNGNINEVKKLKSQFGNKAMYVVPASSSRMNEHQNIRPTINAITELEMDNEQYKTKQQWYELIKQGKLCDYYSQDEDSYFLEYDGLVYDYTNPIKAAWIGDLTCESIIQVVQRQQISMMSYFWSNVIENSSEFITNITTQKVESDTMAIEVWDFLSMLLENDINENISQYINSVPLDRCYVYPARNVTWLYDNKSNSFKIKNYKKEIEIKSSYGKFINELLLNNGDMRRTKKEHMATPDNKRTLLLNDEVLKLIKKCLHTLYVNDMIHITIARNIN